MPHKLLNSSSEYFIIHIILQNSAVLVIFKQAVRIDLKQNDLIAFFAVKFTYTLWK
jgi:hypothetical protein